MRERLITPMQNLLSELLGKFGVSFLKASNRLRHAKESFPERTNLIELLLQPRTGQSHEKPEILKAYLQWINDDKVNFPYTDSAIENGHTLYDNTVNLSNQIRNNPNLLIKDDLRVLLNDIVANCSTHLITFADMSDLKEQQIKTRAREIQQYYLEILDMLPHKSNTQ